MSIVYRFFGQYQVTKPLVVVKDIELIKKITIKDFEHFLDHSIFIKQDNDPLFGRGLINLRG